MSEFKGTPGPWSVSDCPMKGARTDRVDDGRIKLIDFNDGTYEGTLAIVQTEESEANAHLIAAAPDLLEALQEVVAISDRKHEAWDKAHAAIAKALNTNTTER